MNGQASFETARDTIRHEIHSPSPAQFPYGTRGTSVLEHETHERCPQCFSAMMQPISFKFAPNVLIFEINSRNIKVSKTLIFEQGETGVLDVKGLIYHGDCHFTSCIIGIDGIVWYHDGMTTGISCENEGNFDKMSSRNLLKCKGKKLILVVYARV